MSHSNVVEGVLHVGLLAQLFLRADSRSRQEPRIGWEEVTARLGAMAALVADREVIEALPGTDWASMLRRMRKHWPEKDATGAGPSRSILAMLELAESLLGETRDEVVPRHRGSAFDDPPGEVLWRAANPERQLEREVAPVEPDVVPVEPLSAEARFTAAGYAPTFTVGGRSREGPRELRRGIEVVTAIEIAEAHARAAVEAFKARFKERIERTEAECAQIGVDAEAWGSLQHARAVKAELERDEARSGRMAAEADHAELLRLYEERGAELDAERGENDRLREALTPSGGTKAAYSAEVSVGRALVPWTAVKDVMALIRKRAGLDAPPDIPAVRAQAESDVRALHERLGAEGGGANGR